MFVSTIAEDRITAIVSGHPVIVKDKTLIVAGQTFKIEEIQELLKFITVNDGDIKVCQKLLKDTRL